MSGCHPFGAAVRIWPVRTMVPGVRAYEAGRVSTKAGTPLTRLLPSRVLTEQEAAWRHRFVCVLVALHVPVLLVVGVLTDHSLRHSLLEPVPVVALLLLASGPFSRRARHLASSLSLLTCSAVLVHLFHGQTELHFHFFVAVAVISLYEDWAVFGAAIGFVALEHGLMGLGSSQAVFGHPGNVLLWALVHAGFVLAECAVLIVYWRASAHASDGERRLQAALWEGHTSVRARLEETDRIRTDLIGTVSHEFRTPLTGIRGAALTLLKRGDRLDPEGRATLLRAVLEQQERLSRLLENMLTAARATAADPAAVAEVDAVAAEVAMLATAAHPDSPAVSVVVEPRTLARIDRHALHQVLANLVDNAQRHGAAHGVTLVAGGQDDHGVWVAVSNEGHVSEAEVTKLFEPFTQADSGPTRSQEGLGMGLYVVRRLTEVYGGTVSARSEGGWVTVELRLEAVEERRRAPLAQALQPPTSDPMPKVTSIAAPPSRS